MDKGWKISIALVSCIMLFSFLFVYFNGNLEQYDSEVFKKERFKDSDLDVFVNQNFSEHNTSERNDGISYIVIHYTGITLDAEDIIKSYNLSSYTNGSADFFVSHKGYIYQYNPYLDNRYSWAVGGGKADNEGGTLHGVVTNENSVNIELCVTNSGNNLEANSDDWTFNQDTLISAKNLIVYLMDYYNIGIDNVVRHYDVNGKICPGVVGWNKDSGSEDEWEKFIADIKNMT